MKRLISLLMVCAFIASCGFTPYRIVLDPVVTPTPSQSGAAKKMQVTVKDMRGEAGKVIGYWGKPEKKDAPITTSQDVAAVVKGVVESGLRTKGFVPTDKAPVDLVVELRQLSYANDYSDWKKIRAVAQAELEVRVGAFSHSYKGQDQEWYLIAPNQKENEAHINHALAKAISQMLADDALITTLAR